MGKLEFNGQLRYLFVLATAKQDYGFKYVTSIMIQRVLYTLCRIDADSPID